jgi:hypothetical protein
MTQQEIVEQLKKHGVHNLEDFAKFVVKEAQQGNENAPAKNGVIIHSHGFVTH